MDLSLFPLLVAANQYRIFNLNLPDIFGMPASPLIVLGLIIASVVAGTLIARAARLRDYGWKLGLILSTVTVSTFVILTGEFKLGVDLKGGVILVYEVDELETSQLRGTRDDSDWRMNELIGVLTRRLNPTGLKEIVIRPFGPKQVEIVVPEVDPKEIEYIKEQIRTGGVLQFMIVSSKDKDADVVKAAELQAEPSSKTRLDRFVVDADGQRVGYWAALAHEKGDDSPFRALDAIENSLLRDGRTGEILESIPPAALESTLKQRGISRVDVLMVYNADFAIRGDDLASAYPGMDEAFRPAIMFTMRTEGSAKMGHITSENLQRKLAIIFDNALLSAPVIQSTIREQGQITGNFEQEEVDFIVGILKSGSMPVIMQEEPISENQIGSTLGRETVLQGSRSILIASALVFAFMAVYYRFSGLVACFALALNLGLVVAIMVALQAPFTLPGLAGLVLTLAMSVDANVLISERMREELQRGAALRMAIRNGFDKALSAIVDGNLTTFLTALVLYAIGTDQIKGFGMTLMLGNITSMFTAIFCARVILEFGERSRWLKSLSMMSFLTNPRVDWVRFFGPAVAGSAILVLIGLVATVARGKGLFDIDLAGGTSVTFFLKEPLPEQKVRERLDAVFENLTNPETNSRADHNVYGMTVETQPADTVYKVDSSLPDVELLKKTVQKAFETDNGGSLLRTYQIDIGPIEEVAATPPAAVSSPATASQPASSQPAPASPAAPRAEKSDTADKSKTESTTPPPPAPPAKTSDTAPKTDAPEPDAEKAPKAEYKPTEDKSADDKPANDSPAAGDCGAEQEQDAAQPQANQEQPATPAAKTAETPATSESKSAAPAAASSPATPDSSASATTSPQVSAATPKMRSTTTLKFPGSPISAASLKARIQESAREIINQDLTDIDVKNTKWDGLDNSTFEEWTVSLPLPADQARAVFTELQKSVSGAVIWQTSSKIGGQVSKDTQQRALGALTVSLLGIVAYVWFRFQAVAWGLAAVAALAHDALVMLTAIALSYWVVGPLGFLGVEEFKISLPVVAAFLTILGYSVNDTIVIFDRLREIRGKSPHITRQMLNDAVNQTLSRNIILAGITLTVVTILYAFGGPGIHAFAFALLTGVLSGCYTTLVIAAPLLHWLLNRGQQPSPAGSTPSAAKLETRRSIA